MKASERRRPRPRQTLMETAFVSSTRSSTEDLDEVDRIANHPVLRTAAEFDSGSGVLGGMRRSRSEMGGSVDRGVSSFLARSPVSGGGARISGRGMSRSTTACSHLASAHFTSPSLTLSMAGPRPGSSPLQAPQYRSKTPIRTRVTAIIESSTRKCMTPPPSLRQAPAPCDPGPSPPNTAPLPKKVRSPLVEMESTQLQSSSRSLSSCVSQASDSGLNMNKLSEICQRNFVENYSSSSESVSAAQKNRWSENQITGREFVKTSQAPLNEDLNRNSRLDNTVSGSRGPRFSMFHPKAVLKMERRMASSGCSSLISSMESVESNTSEAAESMSESVTSGVPSSGPPSDLVTSSSSLDLRPASAQAGPNTNRMSRIMSKLQILSPISDKSQEQTSSSPASDTKSPSEPGDSGLGLFRKKKRNVDLNLNFHESGHGTEGQGVSFKTLRTPDIQQYLNVPWDIPKLKSKLKNKRNCFRGQSSSPETSPKKVVMKKSPDVEVILRDGQQSDTAESKLRSKHLNIKFDDYSEVKCNQASVKTPELEKFLEVPWEVPKLRKKIANRKKMKTLVNIQGSDSGISMSSQETKDILQPTSWTRPKLKQRSQIYIGLSDSCNPSTRGETSPEPEPTDIPGSNRLGPGQADDESSSSSSLPHSSVPANSEFHFELAVKPKKKAGGEDNVFVGSRDYSSSRERVSGGDQGDSPAQGGLSPAASDIKPSVLTCNLSDKDKESGDSNSQLTSSVEMKTNDLKPSLNFLSENDLSDLPFSMPKLQRKMKESGGGGLGLPGLVPRAVFPPPGLGLPPPQPPEARPSLDLRLGPRQPRPVSLHASTPSHAAISQLKLPLRGLERNLSPGVAGGLTPSHSVKRKPLLFLTPSVNLAQSIEVDTSLPLENQEWYHGVMSRGEAEQVLKTHSEGSYLLRASLDTRTASEAGLNRTEYSLAIKSSRGFMHLRISRVDDGENTSFKLGDFDKKFSSIVGMVHHYTINRLPIKGAEHMCLLTPVTEELL